jgi:hypothetical protein
MSWTLLIFHLQYKSELKQLLLCVRCYCRLVDFGLPYCQEDSKRKEQSAAFGYVSNCTKILWSKMPPSATL